MTKGEIIDFVTKEIGQTDSVSRDICGMFVNRRYEMIANAEWWRDLQTTATVTTSIGDPLVDFPSSMTRIISIRSGSNVVLEPVTEAFILDTDPTALERTGRPTSYSEFLDDDGNRHIKLYPIPNAVISLYVVGKRMPTLLATDDAAPIIRNIDNTLIAFVYGDMLRRQRVFTKADELYKEAAAQLDAMRQLEQQQSNQLRRSKALTLSSDSLSEMTDTVASRCSMWSADDTITIKDFIRRNYQRVYDMALWPESLVLATVDRTAAQVVLPDEFGLVVALRVNSDYAALVPADQSTYFKIVPQIFEQSGSPVAFSILTPVGVRTLPPQVEALSLVSDDADDFSPVFIRGENDGTVIEETVTLTGTTPVVTTNAFDTPLVVGKDLTNGNVTITGADSATLLQTLGPNDRAKQHIRLWLQPAPDANTQSTCLVLGKRRLRPLVADQDVPMISGLGNILVDMTTSNCLITKGNPESAAVADKSAQLDLSNLVSRETQQGAFSAVVVPDVEPRESWLDYGYGYDSWFLAK